MKAESNKALNLNIISGRLNGLHLPEPYIVY